MDRRPVSTGAREQLLHIEEATYTLATVVPPVVLEQKFLSMLTPSDVDVNQARPTNTTSTITEQISFPTSTSAATSLPQPVSATTAAEVAPSVTTAADSETAIVGGKRPLREESDVIIIIETQDDENKKETTSDVPGADSSKNHSDQEQSHLQEQKPEEATSNLSTEQLSSERGRDRGKKGIKPGVQFSDVSPKRDVSDVMQFFQEQEKNLQDRFLSLPKKPQKKQRSPSPKLQQAAGLEHLDNLIRLMEQLTSLKDENSRLRKRCDYLESTKVLLQAKRDLSLESSSSSSRLATSQSKHKDNHHHHSHRHHHHHEENGKDTTLTSVRDPLLFSEVGDRASRPRIPSAEELEYFELAESSSDQRPKKPKAAMHKRSFSTGSLEVPSEILSDVGGVETRKRHKGKSGRSIFSKSSGQKQKTKSSKWARVKRVLTGQKLYEDLGTTLRTLRDLGKSSQVRYSTTETSPVRYSSTETSRVRYSTPGMVSSVRDFSSVSSRASGGDARPSDSDASRIHEMFAVRTSLAEVSTELTEAEDTDLTSEIWMGPPDWWEEYEARKENGGTSTSSEVSSVIEVTTMYLGGKKDTATPTTTTVTSTTTAPTTASMTIQEKYLTIDKPLPRRQSSPSLVIKETAEEDDILKEMTTSTESCRLLHKSASCKSADLDLPGSGEGIQMKKPHKSAWGRVKDIIHTRKDSFKKRPKRDKSGVDSEETSEIDIEGLMEEQWRPEVLDEHLISRSTPKTSPMITRQQTIKTNGDSVSGAASSLPKSRASSYHQGTSPGHFEMAALLAGNMSDEFNRKMQEWEQIKSKKSASFRVSVDESDVGSLDVTRSSHEFPVRVVDLRDLRGRVPDSVSEGITPEESNTSMEVLGAPSVNLEEIQRRMTDSFSRKMLEWERLKYKGGPAPVREPSPESERKEKGRKDDKQKSKRSREEKEKEKWERQREREMQKVEREQLKLEKEKLRIEKERLRTLERQAKLEKLKGRLSQAEPEGGFKNPALGALSEYKITADFARKLHEWELRKGLSHDVSNSIYLEAQKMSMQRLRQGGRLDSLSKHEQARYALEGGGSRVEGSGEKASPSPPFIFRPFWESSDDPSQIEKFSEASTRDGDDETTTSVTEECLTRSNIATLERANAQLVENLHMKEMEYAAVQEEVRKVNEKLAKVKEAHSVEMAHFHRELSKGNFAGPMKLEVGELETTVGDLEEKIKLMENFGEKLASSMESAAAGKWQSIEGEEAVHTQLVELVEQMRGMLVQASQFEERSQKSMALSNFETLYTQAMKLQVQMNNLRLSHLERDREIMIIKRQLLLQEVNNLLLQADITRRETELHLFYEAKRFASIKRWNTFSGAERQRPQAQVELPVSPVKPGSQRDSRGRPVETPRINIPYLPEELILASAASSSISAPASPLSIGAAGEGSPPMAAAGQQQSSPGAAREQSTDHMEVHLLLTPSMSLREHHVYPGQISSGQFKTKEPSTLAGGSEPQSSLLHPRVLIQVQPRRYPAEQPHSFPATALARLTKPTSSITSSKPASTIPSTSKETKDENLSRTTEDESSKKVSSTKPEFTTVCDSALLHKEMEELKREKRKVERGPPTLRRTESEGLSSVPSPGKVPRQCTTTEAPTQSIPKQRSLDKPRLTKVAPIIDDDSFPATSVIECTESLRVVQETQITPDSELGAVGGINLPAQTERTKRNGHPSVELSNSGCASPRSPVSKYFSRSQREDKDARFKDYKAISPKGSPIATRGKPPLPPHASPGKPTSSFETSVTEKGPRSKSVSDMDDKAAGTTTNKALQESINRFEKCVTVCETEDRPIGLRKTPSPTLHLPRVGLISRVRRLKPAAELLEESQRYRSGHNIYAARILQRYLSKHEDKTDQAKTAHNKENVTGTYVQTIVQRLSRETTPVKSGGPSRTSSDLSLKIGDSPRTSSELVSEIVRKLSSSSGTEPHKSSVPLKDLTNEGQVKKMSQAFSGHPPNGSHERTLSDSDIIRQIDIPSSSVLKAQHRKSCEVALMLSSAATPSSDTSSQMVSSVSSWPESDDSQRPTSSTSPTSCKSLPAIGKSGSDEAGASSAEDIARRRAATYCVSEMEKGRPPGKDDSGNVQTSISASPPKETIPGLKRTTGRGKGDTGKLPSSLSPERRGVGRGKMGTVGVLCKQSISFDLGVSLYAQKSKSGEAVPKSRQIHSWDPSVRAETASVTVTAAGSPSSSTSARSSLPATTGAAATGEGRPVSSSSEGETGPASPTSEKKKKSGRFLDTGWLRKSKKFFKVSK